MKIPQRETLTFEREKDGRVLLIGSFPPEIDITPLVLGSSENPFIRTFVEFNAANGRAVYEVISFDDRANVFACRRTSSPDWFERAHE
jgi:hypothetical protein